MFSKFFSVRTLNANPKPGSMFSKFFRPRKLHAMKMFGMGTPNHCLQQLQRGVTLLHAAAAVSCLTIQRKRHMLALQYRSLWLETPRIKMLETGMTGLRWAVLVVLCIPQVCFPVMLLMSEFQAVMPPTNLAVT